MRIAQSTVALASKREFAYKREEKETFDSWDNSQPRSSTQQQNSGLPAPPSQKIPLPQLKIENPDCRTMYPSKDSEFSKELKIAEMILEMLTGEDVKLNIMYVDLGDQTSPPDISQEALQSMVPGNRSGVGFSFERNITIAETERTDFAAAGIIKTADGREINFNVEMSLSRSFIEKHHISIQGGAPKRQVDPLVLNLDDAPPELTDVKFKFDLDSDGTGDMISFVSGGSAFLALDKNDNNKIDNGAELFGPTSGSGFAELALYDDDGNGWIDEGDAVFQDLRLWTKDAQGNDALSTLKEKNVGAIYLDNIKAQFDFKDAENSSQGLMQTAGVFLRENGTAGTMQQIDLAV